MSEETHMSFDKMQKDENGKATDLEETKLMVHAFSGIVADFLAEHFYVLMKLDQEGTINLLAWSMLAHEVTCMNCRKEKVTEAPEWLQNLSLETLKNIDNL